jgi:hypothetical protein
MKILLDPSKPDSPTFEVDHQIAVALATLNESFIRIRGAGRFGDQTATIVLQRDADVALAALNSVGIHAATAADNLRDKSTVLNSLEL